MARTGVSVLVLATVALLQTAMGAQSVKLSGDMQPADFPAGIVVDSRYSPDGRYVVYRAGQDVYNEIELYSRRIDGGGNPEPVKLNGPLTPFDSSGAEVEASYAISPDSKWVVYTAAQDDPFTKNYYLVPIDGSAAATRLDSARSRWDVCFSPDSLWIVYLAEGVNGNTELFSTRVDGSQGPARLHLPLDSARRADVFNITADSQRVVFSVNGPATGNTFSARIDATQLDYLGFGSSTFELSPDGAFVYFTSSSGIARVPADGSSTPTPLGTPIPHLIRGRSFDLSPNGNRIAYVDSSAGRPMLFSVPADGSTGSTTLTPALPLEREVVDYAFSPDSNRLIYVADGDTDETFEIYSVLADGSAPPVKLNGPLVMDGDVHVHDHAGSRVPLFNAFEVSADSSHVVYRADQETDGVYEIYATPIDGSASPIKLNATLVSSPAFGSIGRVFGDYDSFDISADSARVIYHADQGAPQLYELFSVPIDRSAEPVKLNLPVPAPPGGVHCFPDFRAKPFAIHSDGSEVLYCHRPASPAFYQLYRVPIDGSSGSIRVNGDLDQGPPPGNVEVFEVSPDGQRVVYYADQEEVQQPRFYSAPVDGSALPIAISDVASLTSSIPDFEVSPDGGRLVFAPDNDNFVPTGLFSTPLDGSNLPLRLAPAPFGFAVSPDSSRVVYYGNIDDPSVRRVHSVPIAGGTPIQLSDDLDIPFGFKVSPLGDVVVYQTFSGLFAVPIGGGQVLRLNDDLPDPVHLFLITEDGGHIVYQLNHAGEQAYYSAPIDASASPTYLGGRPVLSPNSFFMLSPDGQWIVYLAEQGTPGEVELYSRRTDGSDAISGARKLSPQVTSADVSASFLISPDSLRVVFYNVQAVLYSAPIDGSVEATRLYPPPGVPAPASENTDFPGFLIDSRSQRVVFPRGQLFSVPIDGSGGLVQLNGNLHGAVGVVNYRITANGRRVVYVANEDPSADEVFEVPIAGGPRVRLSGSLPRFGNVSVALALTSDDERVVYLADGQTDTVDELFSSVLRPPRIRREDDPPRDAGTLTRSVAD